MQGPLTPISQTFRTRKPMANLLFRPEISYEKEKKQALRPKKGKPVQPSQRHSAAYHGDSEGENRESRNGGGKDGEEKSVGTAFKPINTG